MEKEKDKHAPLVVFIASSSECYGAENALLTSVRNLTSEIKPVVVLPEHGTLQQDLDSHGIPTIILPMAVLDRRFFHPARFFLYLLKAVRSYFALLRQFQRVRPDIVHSNNVLILPGAIAAWTLGIPHVWHIREILETHHLPRSLWRVWRWMIVSFSDRIICISTAVSRQFMANEPVTVIHDGIDVRCFVPPQRKKATRQPQQRMVKVGIVGRLEHRRKGQDLLIEAAHLVLEKNRSLEFLIVGDERKGVKDEEQRLRDLVQGYGIDHQVRFRGFVPPAQMPSLYHEIDILVLCSKQPEGLAIVLLEGMACGVAVISFAEGGPLDIIRHRVNGILTPPHDVNALAEAILTLAEDPALRFSLSREGRRSVETLFRDDLNARLIGDVYRRIRKEQLYRSLNR
jgi:glycosyltransferase involved in cell wall biosynthesis